MARLGFRTELMEIIGNRVASAASERAQRASERSDLHAGTGAAVGCFRSKFEISARLRVIGATDALRRWGYFETWGYFGM